MHYQLSVKYPQKRAFITGAASGLGKALCLELAKDGWLIGMSDIREEALLQAAEVVRNAGAKTLTYQLDVSDKVAYQKVAENFLQNTGGIDLLFNNAGVGDGGKFEEYGLDNWEWMVGINQMSVIYGCHFFIPVFKKQGYGHILNTSSLAAVSAPPEMAAYNATKAAVVAISETLYCELMDNNIQVSCIQPYFFKTNIDQFARGGENIRVATKAFIQHSGLEADVVAKEILHRAAKGELYILIPKLARQMWLLKRLAPIWYRNKVKKAFYAALEKVNNRRNK
jgi:NADP-dependent 3-hydroxy acid dehydrogenase YdfG